ncbi:MAG: hypothetical protein IJS09_10130 [Treponema sp.]|nr:hypothetical protein [Treponema sp.]
MKKVLCFIATLAFCCGAFSQNSFFDNYVYQSWNTFGDLSGTTVTDLIQTKDGYINIGTYEGLVKFDGVAFSTYKQRKDNDLHFLSVRTMLEDSKGNLWVGSNDEGVQRLSPGSYKHYSTQNGLPNNSIRALAEDRQGNIWIGTAAGVVYITPAGHMMTPQFEAGTVSKGIIATQLYCDTAGRVWLLTANERGLFMFSDGIFRTRPELEQFGIYFATTICQDLQGTFWIGLGEQGIITVSNGIVKKLRTGTLLDHTPATSTLLDGNGSIWFGTENGIIVYNNGRYYRYESEALYMAKINRIICDREGNMWIATDRSGVGKLTHGKFKMIKLGIAVNSVTEDRYGKVWVGTDTGVRCYENDVEVETPLTTYTKGVRIRDVQATKNGDILVSCYTKPGQLRYSKGTIKSWTTDDGLAGNKVRVAIEPNTDELYVGTTTGLSIIHADGSIKNFKQIDGLENEYVMALYQDTNDIIWIGTDGNGIYLMKDEKIISHITSDDGIAGNVIFKITQDMDGAFWICSGSGITRCPGFDSNNGKPTLCENINSEQGIGTDSVFQILADSTNNLWMISNHGIASAPFKEILDAAAGKNTKVNTKFYNKNDGLDSGGPTSTAKSITDKHGRFWFTMVDGVAIYDPVRVFENSIMPLVKIESVSIDGKVYTDLTSTITLKPGTKRVDIKFTGLSFDAPERIQFTHKLTNFEDDYTMADSRRTVSYTNLPPGKHTFLVNAINGDGFYSEQAETVLFMQKPYFWQRPVFWIIIGLLVMGSFVGIFYLKQRAIRRENIRLENMVQRRTAELAQEKDKSDRLIRAILPDKIADQLKGEIHAIGENFADVTMLFSDIVGFTTTSSGHTAAEIVGALNDLFIRFDERAKKMGIEKIKTIGDAYMAACGVPIPVENHAQIMVAFAKGMYEDLEDYNKHAQIPFTIRIGLNCGPVTAGVIGKTKFIYDVWGNTVNVASRMESVCTPGKIRVSENVYQHLKDSDIQFSNPIECDIKGKGLMITYEIV